MQNCVVPLLVILAIFLILVMPWGLEPEDDVEQSADNVFIELSDEEEES